jgi:hypothetical protein
MRLTDSKSDAVVTAEHSGSLRELKPWREVGWIFKDGESVAIERHGEEVRVRMLVD